MRGTLRLKPEIALLPVVGQLDHLGAVLFVHLGPGERYAGHAPLLAVRRLGQLDPRISHSSLLLLHPISSPTGLDLRLGGSGARGTSTHEMTASRVRECRRMN